MKFITTWSARPGSLPEAARRFLAGEGQPPPQIQILGRWHKADLSGGWTLSETADASAAYEYSLMWVDILDIQTSPVVEDDAAATALAKRYSK